MKIFVFLFAEWLTLIKEIASEVAAGDPISTVLALLFLIAAVIALIVVCVLVHKRKKSGGNTNNREDRNLNVTEESVAQQVTCVANELANTRRCKEELEQKNRELSEELHKQKEFMDFIEYMLMNDFTILPKICLAVNSNSILAFNQVDIRKLTVTYTYDFCKWDNEDPSNEGISFEYDSQVKFEMKVNNCDLPGEYRRYAGNMYAKKLVPVYQKHGNSSAFTKVEAKNYRDITEMKANIAQYSWELSRRNIGVGPAFDMEYYWEYKEKWNYKDNKEYKDTGKAKGKGILIHYPIHYGKSIEEFEIKVVFTGKRVRVTDMIVEKIGKIGKAQTYGTTQITGEKKWIASNQISFSFIPKVDKCEAIYAKVEWVLQEDD